MPRRERRRFTPEFKARSVELIEPSGKSIAEICRELDLSQSAVRRWVELARLDRGEKEGLSSDERAELARLRREVRTLAEEREILKKAAVGSARHGNTSILMSQSRGLGWHEHDGCIRPRSAGSCGSAGRPENRLSDIARALDRAPGTIHCTLRERGGVCPPERRRAQAGASGRRARGDLAGRRHRLSRCARSPAALSAHPLTISREIARNGGRGRYRATPADGRAWHAARRP